MPSILIVCTANVCRSPLAAVLLRGLLADAGLTTIIRVESAGSAAAGDSATCPSVCNRLQHDPRASAAAAEHVSRRLTAPMLEAADLVLVPDLANRARVVSLQPSVRRRTLLLRDAAAHAPSTFRTVTDAPTLESNEQSMPVGAEDAFAAWVAALRTARMRAPHVTAHRFSFRPHAARDLEIADGHNLGARRHRQTLDVVEASVVTLARSLTGIDDLRGSGPSV